MATSRRVGNYATSANAVMRSSDQIFDAAMSAKPDFTKISKEAIKGRSLERRAVTKAEGEVAAAGIRAARDVKGYGYKADALISEGKSKGKKARMAGALGALGSLAGGFVELLDSIIKEENDFPIPVSEVKHAEEPLYSVSHGLFQAADLNISE